MIYPPQFSVGEIAIAIDPHGLYDKMECEIVKNLHHASGFRIGKNGFSLEDPMDKGMMYGIKFQCESRMLLAFPWELRKRPIPPEHVEVDEACEIES